MDRLRFEPAEAASADAAARLIYDTDPRLFDCFFENDYSRFLLFCTNQWREQQSLYSFSNATAAVVGEKLAGLELGYDRKGRDRAIPNMAKRTKDLLTPEAFSHYAKIGGYVRYLTPPIPNNAYYVMFLATAPEERGKGIGGKLLENAFDRARGQGYDACHLDVASDNRAVRFYQSLGMEILSESRVIPLEKMGVKSHFRMIKKLRNLKSS
jgi:ribosomal protein S18 acetylase RimI-like enzyme